MLVPVAAGENDVEIHLATTGTSGRGPGWSLLSLGLLMMGWRWTLTFERRKRVKPGKVLIATSNAGKLRDFAGAAAVHWHRLRHSRVFLAAAGRRRWPYV